MSTSAVLAGEDRRGRALSDRVGAGQRAAKQLAASLTSTVRRFNASVLGQLTVPIYQGGAEYSPIRQAKETLGQRRIDLDTARDQVRADRGAVLGPARGRQGQYRGDAGAGAGRRDRAQRRARGGPRRPAHHARRAQRAAGTGQCARRAGDRAARPRGGVLYAAVGGRPAVAAGARPAACRSTIRRCITSRCATPGSACARRTAAEPRAVSTATVSASRCVRHRLPHLLSLWRINVAWRFDSSRRLALACGDSERRRDAAMSQPAKAQEPSMEEILASIRRIIADDDATKPRRQAAEPPPPPLAATAHGAAAAAAVAPPSPPPPAAGRHRAHARRCSSRPAPRPPRRRRADVLDLTEAMARRPSRPAPTLPHHRRRSPTWSSPTGCRHASRRCAAAEAPRRWSRKPRRQCRSAATPRPRAAVDVDRAPRSTARSIRWPTPCSGKTRARSRTWCKEMLRPMLKSWLDDNLPGLVERIVRAEIERVSRGR